MRRVVAVALLVLLCASPASAQMAKTQEFVEPLETQFSDNNHTFSLPGASVVGRVIFVFVWSSIPRTISSIVDAGSTTYTPVDRLAAAAGATEIRCGIATSTSAGTNITVTLSGNDSSAHVAAVEFSGNATATPCNTSAVVDQQTNTALLTGVPHTTDGVTPAVAGSNVVIAFLKRSSGVYTEDTNFTEIVMPHDNTYLGYRLNLTGLQNFAFTADATESSWIQLMAFSGAGAGASSPKGIMLKGCCQ